MFSVRRILAPGDYESEKASRTLLDNSPKYTFGVKSDMKKPVDTPGKLVTKRTHTL